MNRLLYWTCIITGILIINSCNSYANYKITIKNNGWKDTSMILGSYLKGNMFVVDTFEIDSKGEVQIVADTLLPNGIYSAYFPDKKYFDFLVSTDQTFELHVDTADFISSKIIKGADETKAFSDYHKFMVEKQRERQSLMNHYRPLASDKDSLAVARQKMDKLNKAVNAKWEADAENFKGTFYGTLIKSFIPVQFEPGNEYDMHPKRDSILAMKKYYFDANHYFDNTDLTEPGLWRTSFHQARIENYLNKVLIPRPDSIIPYAVKLVEASKNNNETFRFMSTTILDFAVKSDIMGMESLSVRISKDYFLNGDAYWADSTLLTKLAELVAKEENTLLGNKAPNLIMEDWQEGFHSLSQVNAPYTVLIFFEPNCSHCKKTIPEIYNKVFMKYKDKGLKVFCVYTQTDKDEWHEFIHEQQLYDWIHVWDPRNSSNFRYYYDVAVTPRIFLLDKDKTIIGKKIGTENLDLMLDRLYKYGSL